jgi:hypothetical protein
MPVIDAIQKYRVYSASLTSHDLEKIATVSETCKTFLKERAIRWLHNHRSSTILYQYSSDTTPIVTKETFKRQWENLSVVRRGRSSKDLLVQRAFLTEASGPPIAIFMEPQEVKDKTAFTHYNAARQFMAFPREYGHQGGCVKHFVMDRAILSSTTRLLAKTQVLLNEADDDVLDRVRSSPLFDTVEHTGWMRLPRRSRRPQVGRARFHQRQGDIAIMLYLCRIIAKRLRHLSAPCAFLDQPATCV